MEKILFFGFIKEHQHSLHVPTTAISQFEIVSYDPEMKEKILAYLKCGVTVLGPFMEAITPLLNAPNKEDNTIYGFEYLTDGQWIWPNYIWYYIQHFNFKINDEFLKHMSSENFICSKQMDLNTLKRVEHFLKYGNNEVW